jgi:pimeloyl-ACP methyl ester carboxylesterase
VSASERLSELPEPKRSRLRDEWWSEIDKLPAVADTINSMSRGAREEMRAASDTFQQAIAARPLPDVPIILLAAGRQDMSAAQAMSPAFRELNEDNRLGSTSIEAHAKWAGETPGAKLRIVRNSGHNIQSDQPQSVIDAVREIVRMSSHRFPEHNRAWFELNKS